MFKSFIYAFLSISLFILVPSELRGQERSISYQDLQWLSYYNQTYLNNQTYFIGDVSARFRNGFGEKIQTIVRAGFGKHINDNVSVNLGYGQVAFYGADQLRILEFRPYQEVLVKTPISKVGMRHRFRTEQRFMENKWTGSSTFYLRMRYKVMFSVPLEKKVNPKFHFNFGNEIALNLAGSSSEYFFDQNRILVGLSYRMNDNIKLNFTYNHRLVSAYRDNLYRQEYIAWIGLIHTIKPRRK